MTQIPLNQSSPQSAHRVLPRAKGEGFTACSPAAPRTAFSSSKKADRVQRVSALWVRVAGERGVALGTWGEAPSVARRQVIALSTVCMGAETLLSRKKSNFEIFAADTKQPKQ